MRFDFDFTRAEWEEILAGVDFTDLELKIIHLRRRGWKWIDICMELDFSYTHMHRFKNRIAAKILRYIS